MKTSAEIREEIGRQFDRAQAIVDVAKGAGRDLNDDEIAEIDRINGNGDPKSKDYKPGIIDKLKADLQRAENIENRERELNESRRSNNPINDVKTRQGAGEGDGKPAPDANKPRASTVIIPASARFRLSSLKAYKGESADEKAYLSGRFILATIYRHEGSQQWCKDHGIETRPQNAVMKESDNALGGFLVPDEMERAIIDLREERGVFRRETRMRTMSSDSLSIPRRSGGVTAYAVGEANQITESTKNWSEIKLESKKWGVLCKVSSELSEDAVIGIADDITSEIAYAFADKEDECGFNGDGTSTYHGIVGLKNALQAGSEVTAATGNTSFDTLDLADFIAMVGKLPQYALANAKWYISRAGWAASMLRLAEAAGGNTVQNIMGGMGPTFLGYPVVWVQVMNSTLTTQASTEGLCYFGDIRQGTTMGLRRGVSIESSREAGDAFAYDQVWIKGTTRFDINVHERGTASAAGSVIQLITPGS